MTLQVIFDRLEAMRERTPPGVDELAAIIGQDDIGKGYEVGNVVVGNGFRRPLREMAFY